MILDCQNISKAFGTNVILDNVSFHLEDKEKMAIVGINGAGKTTLLKIIMQEEEADSGQIVLSKDRTIGYLSQHQDIFYDDTVYGVMEDAVKPVIELQDKIRKLEQDMTTLTGDELKAALSTYNRYTHEFEYKNGYAYESEGSVYFDVEKYNKDHHYGKLSGRNLDDVLNTTRELDGQSEKHNSFDFALWKKASPEHIMRWPSPWSDGFPGWHLECSTMSTKYLGEEFDIHGGGMDLLFPHHECEIAQAVASQGDEMVRYWMHNNMITVNGQKMGKSLGNFITLEEFFTGNHPKLTSSYSPMTIRFFILQAHYRSTVDFSNEALASSKKGLDRMMDAYANLSRITPKDGGEITLKDVEALKDKCYEAMNDDFNTPILISHLFDACHTINQLADGQKTIAPDALEELTKLFSEFAFDVLGLRKEASSNEGREKSFGAAVDLLLEPRQKAKAAKDWATSDRIRDELARLGFEVKDTKDGATWKLNK